MHLLCKLVILLSACLTHTSLAAIEPQLRLGGIKGTLIAADSRQPISGALIETVGTSLSAISDERGVFVIDKVPVGGYVLRVLFGAYRPIFKSDVVVKSNRHTMVSIEMDLLPALAETVSVQGNYFVASQDLPPSRVDFSAEEVRRVPGAEGDLSRAIFALPSVAKVNDMYNGLVVRGGSPSENIFYIDNIEVPNINHFTVQGASGGTIGLVNVEFIEGVDFIAGGFPARFGNKLSSAMDIRFREGNRDKLDLQFDFNMAGVGLTAEGPLGKAGSFLLSGRLSYLDLISGMLGMGGTVPRYGDIQGKAVVDMGVKHRLSVLGLWGKDEVQFEKENSLKDGNDAYGDVSGGQHTFGINWFASWSPTLYSDTSFSLSEQSFARIFNKVATDEKLFYNQSKDRSFSLRSVFNWTPSNRFHLNFGVDAKRLVSEYYYGYVAGYDERGNRYEGVDRAILVNAGLIGGFFQADWHLFPALTASLGFRLDHGEYNSQTHLSPRFSLNWATSSRLTLHGAVGLYFQQLPLLMLYQRPEFRQLKDPQAGQWIVGAKYLLNESTQLSVEAYDKEYDRFPIDPIKPDRFLMDFYGHGSMYETYGDLLAQQRARSYGVEVVLQKKLKDKLYGMINAAWFRTRYQTLSGEWKNREFDNQFLLALQGGYRPSNSWEFGLRWMLAGGTPYTPFNEELSRFIGQGVQDTSRINSERKPLYHSLNLRVDRRQNFKTWNMVWYVSIWNVYNRRNVGFYFWDVDRQRPGAKHQWGILPVGGVEIEF